MTTTTLNTKSFHAAATPSVGDAFRQLMSALIAKLPSPTKPVASALSVTEEANRVREMAYDYISTDPGFADDLFAAADRYELQHLAAASQPTIQ